MPKDPYGPGIFLGASWGLWWPSSCFIVSGLLLYFSLLLNSILTKQSITLECWLARLPFHSIFYYIYINSCQKPHISEPWLARLRFSLISCSVLIKSHFWSHCLAGLDFLISHSVFTKNIYIYIYRVLEPWLAKP